MPQVLVYAAYYAAAYVTGSAAVAFAAAAVASYGVGRYQQRKAQAKAREAYNASLRDRLEMVDIQANAPATLALGRVRTVEGIRRRWVSGPNDENLTLVVSFAGHEIDGFENFYFNDQVLTLDANGYVNEGPYRLEGQESASHVGTANSSGFFAYLLPALVVNGTVSVSYADGSTDAGLQITYLSGTILNVQTNRGAVPIVVNWQQYNGKALARIRTWTGAPGQNVGAALAAEYPGKISATDRFEGMAIAVIDLTYHPDAFPRGIPNITARLRGAKVLDPRTGVTAWSENPALLAYHYARHAHGWGVPEAEIRTADIVAAANLCDQSTVFPWRKADGSTGSDTMPRYTCGLVVPTNGDPRAAMDEIIETMAGRWGWAGGTWRVRAGHAASPVFALDESWIGAPLDDAGDFPSEPMVTLSNGVPRESKVNTITGTCVDKTQRYQALPFPAVIDAALVAQEGSYPLEVEYQGVTDIAHAQQLARIAIRTGQAALRMEARCNLKAWRVELFDVGAITLPRYGFDAKLFEVTGWRWHPTEGVRLTLAETSAAIYEVAELTGRDPAPNSNLPSLFDVPVPVLAEPESGTNHLVLQRDGTITPRLLVKWDPIDKASVLEGGRIEVRYGRSGVNPALWQTVTVPGGDTQVYLEPVQEGRVYIVTARAHTGLVAGAWAPQRIHFVQGKSAPPAAVAGFSLQVVPGALRGIRTRSTEADWAGTSYRYGASYATGTPVPGTSDRDGFTWPSPFLGPVTVWAADYDTSGNIGPAVSATITVDNRALVTAGGALNRNPACDDPTAWLLSSGVQLASGANWPGAVGTSYLRCASGLNQLAWSAETIPLDPNRRYALTASLSAAAGNNRNNYLVVDMFDVAGNRVAEGWGGTYSGYTFGGLVPGDATGRQYGQVFGKNTPRPIPANVAYCRIGVWFQYSPGSGAAEQLAQDVRLQEVIGYREVATDNIVPNAATDISTGRVNDDTWIAPFLTNANKSYAEFIWTNNLDRSVTLELSATFARLYQIAGSNPDQATFFNSIGGQLTGPGGAFSSFSYPDYLSPLATQVMSSGSVDQKSYSLVTSIDVPIGWTVVAGCNLNASRASAFSGDTTVRTFGLSFRVVKVKA